jgi:hypothetical protein
VNIKSGQRLKGERQSLANVMPAGEVFSFTELPHLLVEIMESRADFVEFGQLNSGPAVASPAACGQWRGEEKISA